MSVHSETKDRNWSGIILLFWSVYLTFFRPSSRVRVCYLVCTVIVNVTVCILGVCMYTMFNIMQYVYLYVYTYLLLQYKHNERLLGY